MHPRRPRTRATQRWSPPAVKDAVSAVAVRREGRVYAAAVSSADSSSIRVVMDARAISDALERIAVSIAERHPRLEGVVLVAVRRGGIAVGARLRDLLAARTGVTAPLGSVDITLYRDDAATALPNPQIGPSEIPVDVDGGVVILVDDVLYTGRTTRAAIDAVMDYGRPATLELAVLVDRGHRELPIQADHTGARIDTARSERVDVRMEDRDAAAPRVEVRTTAAGARA